VLDGTQNVLPATQFIYSAASNRVAINRNIDSMNFKKTVPVYYLEDNKEELFKKFTFSEKLSKSTFMKYLNKDGIYKKPFRLSLIFI
jgi:hypothetical protein